MGHMAYAIHNTYRQDARFQARMQGYGAYVGYTWVHVGGCGAVLLDLECALRVRLMRALGARLQSALCSFVQVTAVVALSAEFS
jgi:hypothetical protein